MPKKEPVIPIITKSNIPMTLEQYRTESFKTDTATFAKFLGFNVKLYSKFESGEEPMLLSEAFSIMDKLNEFFDDHDAKREVGLIDLFLWCRQETIWKQKNKTRQVYKSHRKCENLKRMTPEERIMVRLGAEPPDHFRKYERKQK